MQEIKVLVPEPRVPDFYKWFGVWLAGEASSAVPVAAVASDDKLTWANTPEDQKAAEILWKKLSSRAQTLFGHLADRPGETFTGEELAHALDIPNGRYGVAGVLAWPGRYCLAMGRHLPIEYVADGATYRMEPDVAEIFREARDSE